jgi:DNA-directed RNA polymerase I subunit RPA1
MFKLDSEIIAHRLFGVSFAFLTDSEISELSVVDVRNPITFDALDNPIPHGLHDKKMGVSPFDHSGTCVTCGLTSVHCPGHHGHI